MTKGRSFGKEERKEKTEGKGKEISTGKITKLKKLCDKHKRLDLQLEKLTRQVQNTFYEWETSRRNKEKLLELTQRVEECSNEIDTLHKEITSTL